MVDPNEVIYSGIEDLIVLHNTPLYAIAVFRYFGVVRYGMRWHGEENSVGTPSAHGKPTWFILPTELLNGFVKINLNGGK